MIFFFVVSVLRILIHLLSFFLSFFVVEKNPSSLKKTLRWDDNESLSV